MSKISDAVANIQRLAKEKKHEELFLESMQLVFTLKKPETRVEAEDFAPMDEDSRKACLVYLMLGLVEELRKTLG